MLFGFYFIIWLAINGMLLFKNNIYGIDIQFSWRTALALIGAALGLYIVKKSNDKETKNKS